MRRIRYSFAMSLDGYIAGPNDEIDWIVMDPDIDFGEVASGFDTLLMGRRTFEIARSNGGLLSGMKVIVVSRTMRQKDYPNVTILSEDVESSVARLREEPGKDIWLFGGGALFRSLLDARLVDAVEAAVIPVLIGEGIPLASPSPERAKLKLIRTRVYEKSGIALLEYAVEA